MGFFEAKSGHEVRGMMIKLYPTAEQDSLLRALESANKSAWNWMVKQVEDVLAARQAFALRERMVPPRPEWPSEDAYHGLEPEASHALRAAAGRMAREWHGLVHAATKDHPACAFRSIRDIATHHGHKYDYQLLTSVLRWREEAGIERGEGPGGVSPNATMLQSVAKNYFQKSARRKKFRRRQDPMPIQTRTGTCFELGAFGARRDSPFYNCRVKINGLKILGRLPGRAPWGRVLEGVSITRKADGWWASVKQEIAIRKLPPVMPGTVIGIDVGLVCIAAMSDGKMVDNPRGAEYAERLAGRAAMGLPTDRMQLRAARRVRHRLHSELIPHVAGVETIKLERLQSKIGQMGSSKVSAMRMVKDLLLQRYGPGRVREVDCRFTSQDCSQCGHRSKESWSYERGRRGKCNSCGYSEDRDVNAARNIAARPPISAGFCGT